MKKNIATLISAFFFSFLISFQPAVAQEGNVLRISGTSTRLGSPYHDWVCEAPPLLTLGSEGNAQPVGGFSQGLPDLSMTVAVESLICDDDDKGKISTMEKKLQSALKAKEHPNVIFKMDDYTLNGDDTATVSGELTIAGETKKIEFNVELTERVNGSDLLAKGFLEGDEPISMTEYGIEPPELFFGALVVGDDVQIEFEVTLNPDSDNQKQVAEIN